MKDFGAITRLPQPINGARKAQWGDTKGIPGFWAPGPGCGLSCGKQQAWPKGQALAGVR